jgi:hypothetical protein
LVYAATCSFRAIVLSWQFFWNTRRQFATVSLAIFTPGQSFPAKTKRIAKSSDWRQKREGGSDRRF